MSSHVFSWDVMIMPFVRAIFSPPSGSYVGRLLPFFLLLRFLFIHPSHTYTREVSHLAPPETPPAHHLNAVIRIKIFGFPRHSFPFLSTSLFPSGCLCFFSINMKFAQPPFSSIC